MSSFGQECVQPSEATSNFYQHGQGCCLTSNAHVEGALFPLQRKQITESDDSTSYCHDEYMSKENRSKHRSLFPRWMKQDEKLTRNQHCCNNLDMSWSVRWWNWTSSPELVYTYIQIGKECFMVSVINIKAIGFPRRTLSRWNTSGEMDGISMV